MNSTLYETPGEAFSRIEIWSERKEYRAFEGYYQDRNTKLNSAPAQIPSDVIDGHVLKVFIPARIALQDSIKKVMKYDSLKVLSESNARFTLESYFLQGVSDFYRLSLGDSSFKTKMYFQFNSTTSERGFITYLNIRHLEEGMHELKVKGPDEMYKRPFVTIPFSRVK